MPAHDNHFCGIFDRFGMGSSEIMDKRMFMYEYFTEKWYPENANNKPNLFVNKRTKKHQWNPEWALKSLLEDKQIDVCKINLCSGKLREDDFCSVPFWHEIYGNPISGKSCEEDIVNAEVLRKVHQYEEIKEKKNQKWFEVKIS